MSRFVNYQVHLCGCRTRFDVIVWRLNISTNIDHDFQRTIPTDGRWCQRCGLAEALWKGESCSEKSKKVPRYFYGRWPEMERIELGERAAYAYDETSPLMHRLCRATGATYDLSHNFWRQVFIQ